MTSERIPLVSDQKQKRKKRLQKRKVDRRTKEVDDDNEDEDEIYSQKPFIDNFQKASELNSNFPVSTLTQQEDLEHIEYFNYNQARNLNIKPTVEVISASSLSPS